MSIPFQKAGVLVAGDEIQILGPALSARVVRFAPTVDVAPVGSALVLRVQDVSGGAPSGYIEATIPAGQKVATPAVGGFNVAAGAPIYVRVVSGPVGVNAASWLSGYFETTAPPATSGAFCTVSELKAFAKITDSAHDTDLALILQTVTAAMQRYMQRDVLSTIYTGEKHSLAYYSTRLVLRHRPLISVEEVRIDGDALDPTEYDLVAPEGILYSAGAWPKGEYHIEVDYTAGYSSVPPELVRACLLQSRYMWTQHAGGGDRFGMAQRAEASGGSSAFVVDDWYPGVETTLKSLRRLI